jgi:multicomponent Na+:H+ antiporter subunit D
VSAHLPTLPIVVPLLAAVLCVPMRWRTAAWAVYLLAGLGSLVSAALLADRVAQDGTQRYAMGGWPAPEGIEFVVADFNVPVLLLVSLVAVVVGVYSRRSVDAEIDPRRVPLAYACLCLTLAGLQGLAVTGDVFNAFVWLEISSLSTYALIALGSRRRALLASFRYLVIGTVGATFVLLGIGLAYAVTGTLNMADLAGRIDGLPDNRALFAAVVFVFVGLAIKMAVFPLHSWLPEAYGEAPSAVSTFLAATSTKVAIYLFMRFAFTVFGAGLVFGRLPLGEVGLLLACAAMVGGSLVACFQSDLKYLLAWSSVAQIGYILAGISLATTAGVSAAYLHLVNHGLTKGALFAAAGLLLLRLGSVRLDDLAGLRRRMPWTFTAVVIGCLGLVGVPPTAGFVSKWALASALVDQGQWLVLAALLGSSLLALVYVGRVVEAAWFREPAGAVVTRSSPPTMVAAVWFLTLLTVYLGVDASFPGDLADSAAAALLGRGGE